MYKDKLNTLFENDEELILKIKSVWNKCAKSAKEIQKAMKEFLGRLRIVKECDGSSIKMQFG